MVKLDFNKEVANGMGGFLPNVTLAKVLSQQILNLQEKDRNKVAKLYAWAFKLVEDGELEIDEADKKMLKEMIEAMAIPIIYKAPLFGVMEEAG